MLGILPSERLSTPFQTVSSLRSRKSRPGAPPIRADSGNGPDVAEPGGVDVTGLYGCSLVRLRHPLGEVRVEVWHPLEPALHEAALELAPHHPGVVKAFLSPTGEVRLRVIPVVAVPSFIAAPPAAALEPRRMRRWGGGRKALQGPLGRGPFESLPGKLDYDKGATSREQARHLVQGRAEILDVVQGQDRHDVVERAWIGKILDTHTRNTGFSGVGSNCRLGPCGSIAVTECPACAKTRANSPSPHPTSSTLAGALPIRPSTNSSTRSCHAAASPTVSHSLY